MRVCLSVVLAFVCAGAVVAALPRDRRQVWAFPEEENSQPAFPPPRRPTQNMPPSRRTTTTTTTTTTRPPSPGGSTTTPAPGIVFTIPNCDCPAPPQYNPVCGTNGVTYVNRQKLNCARQCGTEVEFTRLGVCQTPRK